MTTTTHRRHQLAALVLGVAAITSCGSDDDEAAEHDAEHSDEPSAAAAALLSTVNLAAAAFQDVSAAETAGYTSTIDVLGCFQSAEQGGMGLHYLKDSLMDAELDPAAPEALVYELDAEGNVAGLVAHEYIVPIDAWTSDDPPELFGTELHQHPTLPLWVLHTWIWKDNPAGVFADWNPTVRQCPVGAPIFGVDLP